MANIKQVEIVVGRKDRAAGADRFCAQAEPANHDEESGHVRG